MEFSGYQNSIKAHKQLLCDPTDRNRSLTHGHVIPPKSLSEMSDTRTGMECKLFLKEQASISLLLRAPFQRELGLLRFP